MPSKYAHNVKPKFKMIVQKKSIQVVQWAQETPGLIEILTSLVFEVTNLKQRKKCKKLVRCNLIFRPLK